MQTVYQTVVFNWRNAEIFPASTLFICLAKNPREQVKEAIANPKGKQQPDPGYNFQKQLYP